MEHIVEGAFVALSLVVGALLLFVGLISALEGVEQLMLSGQDPLGLLEGVAICLALTGIGAAGIALPVSRIIRGRRDRCAPSPPIPPTRETTLPTTRMERDVRR
jgi:hypothetical protein